ncbi:hypothetical protein OUZ56_025695 [Daphnia magna]|uniref:Uncharacterized protein n=1 Tax=Daphnia magna TaxID=35525 RepID=A0ABQ9ZKB0_9CRUS|nr:hypothetical protein OUZ56_025695 [Daphnia magna]
MRQSLLCFPAFVGVTKTLRFCWIPHGLSVNVFAEIEEPFECDEEDTKGCWNSQEDLQPIETISAAVPKCEELYDTCDWQQPIWSDG